MNETDLLLIGAAAFIILDPKILNTIGEVSTTAGNITQGTNDLFKDVNYLINNTGIGNFSKFNDFLSDPTSPYYYQTELNNLWSWFN